jgi:DNA-binding NarL/FixJ family response regulator
MAAITRCLVVDDHPAVRQGLGLLFGDAPDLELVGHVERGEDVLEAVERLKPEIAIMDVRLPGIDGISAVKRIAEASASVHTVMFSAYGDKRLLSDALAAGARGYVMKGSPPEDLLRAIRTVKSGKPFVDPSLSPALLMSQVGADAPLSEREREILQLLAEGLHTEEVARRIGLSPETVKSDTKRAVLKLEADTRVHAVAIALRQAIIE